MRNEDDMAGGARVLHLALRKGTSMKPVVESRAVYASLVDETQPDGLLRAIYWDSQTVKRDSSPETTPIKIPAKFVRVPVERVRQWIGAFDTLSTSLHVSSEEDDSLPICSLRIEIDAVYSVFERVWQVTPDEENELQRVWQEVWLQTGLALQTSPGVTDIEENFSCVEPKPDVYDFQTYQPSLNVS